jgi:formamidopyrimidine-DNA glycosylase
MPELPEVQALADTLDRRLMNLRLAALEITAVSALKTADPPYTAILGDRCLGAARFGKFLALSFGVEPGQPDPTWLIIHLARAGWLSLTEKVPSTPARPGRGPLMARLTFVTDDGEPVWSLSLTEAGTRKGAALYVVRDPQEVPSIAALGPDALSIDVGSLSSILDGAGGGRLKNVIRDQRILAGIGNAYSDEILHAARLSPYAPADGLTPAQVQALRDAIVEVLTQASTRSAQVDPTSMKAEKKSGLRIHNCTGEPCPFCRTPIAQVALADRTFQYCPQCQTGGRLLADRRMSRLLK